MQPSQVKDNPLPMKLANMNWAYVDIGSNVSSRMKQAPVKDKLISIEVHCDCGHQWHASQGDEVGQISSDGRMIIGCPKCGATESYMPKS